MQLKRQHFAARLATTDGKTHVHTHTHAHTSESEFVVCQLGGPQLGDDPIHQRRNGLVKTSPALGGSPRFPGQRPSRPANSGSVYTRLSSLCSLLL